MLIKNINYQIIKKKKTGKTWFVDIDGTIFIHNGYLSGKNELIENAKEFLQSIPDNDCLIFVTARPEKYAEMTINSLTKLNKKFDLIIFNVTSGTRVLINDKKITNQKTCVAFNKKRDDSFFPFYAIQGFKPISFIDRIKKLFFIFRFY